MQLVNEFVVPRGVDETWAVLTDVERIAPAMPGAELTEVTPDGQYHGTVKVKVGPVTAKYGGVAKFRELDEANHHMVLDATGKESSGRGRASALVAADLVPEGTDTRVKVTTDLTISGPLAQFGRGAIAEVSSRLLAQFVAQLKETVLADTPAASPGGGSERTATPDAAATGAVAGGAGGPDAAATDAIATDATVTPDPMTIDPGATGTVAGGTAQPAPTQTGPEASSPPSGAPSSGTASSTSAAPGPAAPGATAPGAAASGAVGGTPASAGAAARPAAPTAEVNLLKVAAWPILKRAIPLLILIAVIVVLLVWWLG